jgi:hypothetical protein
MLKFGFYDWALAALAFCTIMWCISVWWQFFRQRNWSKERKAWVSSGKSCGLCNAGHKPTLQSYIMGIPVQVNTTGQYVLLCGFRRMQAFRELFKDMPPILMDEYMFLRDTEAGFDHPDVERFDNLMREV